jgi:preprotein translocase subunit SecA
MAMFSLLKKIFGTDQSRRLKKYFRLVKKINIIELQYQSLSDDDLKAKTAEFKKRLIEGVETTDDIMVEAYAVVKNTCRRLCGKEFKIGSATLIWNLIPYDVQLAGAIALHNGCISEMQTGEGKTLTAALPLYLHALTGKGVHLVTVNDYLAKRDCDWGRAIFEFHGLTTSALTGDISPYDRADIYKADVVYATASELGFDYLRDNSMATKAIEQCQKKPYFAIVDEVDSILIDEARTPLIISGPAEGSRQMYDEMKKPVSSIIALQKACCNRLASEANKVLQKLGLLRDEEQEIKLDKSQIEARDEAIEKFWLVDKGMPRHKILLRAKESPSIRALLDKLDAYYYMDVNKNEKIEKLETLELVVDENDNTFELTDRGMHNWGGDKNDFVMIDLGQEYANIQEDTSLNANEQMEKKVALREMDADKKERYHNVHQLFKAHLLMINDVDYIVDKGSVVIIDENTGRPQPGRRFSDGLHQAIEAKEGLSIQEETQTYASITLQNYFRMYDKLSGMTGTAMTEAQEFKEVYKLVVQEIPPNKKNQRNDGHDEVYMTEREKYQAIVKEIQEIHAKGQPILIGTEAVDVSEKLARILQGKGLKHTVLNAKNHEKEAEIIALAGQKGAITVATNMAGRGTDIKLEDGVEALGGLFVLATTRHQSRRIDRQLRGRCARQGDRGASKFYVSFEDSLMRRFSSNRITSMLKRFRLPEGEAISSPILNRSIETAQKRVEQRNYSVRKNTLEYDDVMNLHRQEVYSFRNQVIHEKNVLRMAHQALEVYVMGLVDTAFEAGSAGAQERLIEALQTDFPINRDNISLEGLKHEETCDYVYKYILGLMNDKLHFQSHQLGAMQHSSGHRVDPSPIIYDIMRTIMVGVIDKHFKRHLLAIDHLRDEVYMCSIAQKDPLIEFKERAFNLFDEFSHNVHRQMCQSIFKFQVTNSDMEGFESAFKKYLKSHKEMNYLNLENVSQVSDYINA